MSVTERGGPFSLLIRPSLSLFGESARRPLHLAAAEDMEMDVEDGLAGGGAIVEYHAEAVNQFEIFGKPCAYAHHPADQLLIFDLHEGRAGNVLFGDDEKMDRRLW